MADELPDKEPPSPLIKEAAKKLHALAKAKKWTIEVLADKAGKPYQTFYNWKGGHSTALIESLEEFARPLGATVQLRVLSPAELAQGGLDVTHPETVLIAQMIDAMPQEDREMWRKQIAEFAAWRRGVPPSNPPPPAADVTPRGRARRTGARR